MAEGGLSIFITLSDFVNRRLIDNKTGLEGALQAAIDATDINDSFFETVIESDLNGLGLSQPEHATGKTSSGAPGFLRQSDLLTSLGQVLAVRSDTFVIRAYGDTVDPFSNEKVEAWCEVVVQRTPDYVDPANSPSDRDGSLNSLNDLMGRQFEIVSFRWLNSNQI